MNAWSGQRGDVMGPAVTRTSSAKATTPPLKNGNDLRETGYLIAVGSRTARFRRKHKNKMLMVILVICVLLLLCLSITMTVLYIKQKRHKPIRLCESKECLRSASNLALSIDHSADPCKNFFQYACGNWDKQHPRPDTYSSYDWFRDKQIKVYTVIRDFLLKNSSGHPLPVQQAKDMYAACMDTETLDKLALYPIFNVLDAIGLPHYPTIINVTDVDYSLYKFDWLDIVIKIKTYLGMDVLIGFDIFTDPKNSSVYRLAMGSPETTNPFPSFQAKRRQVGKKNVNHLSPSSHHEYVWQPTIKNLHNYNNVKENKDDNDVKIAHIHTLYYAELMKVFVVESGAIKSANITEVDLDRNIVAVAHQYYIINEDMYELSAENETDIDEDVFENIPEYTVNELQELTDKIVEINNSTAVPTWKRYLEGVFNISEINLDYDNDKILVSEPDLKYMSLMASYLANLPAIKVELFIWVKVVEVMSIHATTELKALYQRAYERLHPQQTKSPSRSLECASAVNDLLGMAVAYAIAEPDFINNTKPKVEKMLFEMKNSLASLVGKARWMDDDTKLATYQKIIEMKTLIGFPDWLLEEGKLEVYYEGVIIDRKTHLENMINVIQVKIKKALNRFREFNNFTWATNPTDVNAYHTFQENTISLSRDYCMTEVFYFCDEANGYCNSYWGVASQIVSTIDVPTNGCLIQYKLDDEKIIRSRRFDKNGNMLPWWSNDTIQSFVNMTQCFVDQYSGYYLPELDKHIDGKKTLGENIADNGGVREALNALHHHLHRHGHEEKLPGFEHFTEEQLFFLSYGNLWCGVSTEQSLKADLDDEHSPHTIRAQGALQNNKEFARAWHCPRGSPMNPQKRCIIF